MRKDPLCNKPPRRRRTNLDHTIRRRTNHASRGHLGRVQSGITKTIWRDRRQRRGKDQTEEHEARQTIRYRILERFRLVASEAELDDSTGGELLLGGMITELQNAWGASSEEYEHLEALAQWAIRKETKLATVRHIQGSPSTNNIQRETTTPRNPDGTYRPTNNANQN